MAQARKAQVIITANASVAEKVMQELEGAATRASNRMKSLADTGAQIKDKMRQLAAANKQNTDEYKRLDEQLKQNNKDFKAAEKEFQAFNSRLRENVKDSKRVEEVMKQLATTATRDLRRAFQAAKRELDKMSEKDPRRQQLIQDMKKIQQQIDTNTGAIKKQQGAWGALGTTMKNLFAYAGIFAGFNLLKSKLDEAYEANKRFSDSMANVRKVSGLTMDEIGKLANNLSKIDSRTGLGGLMDLSYTGAKLGFGNYGIEGLESFAKSAVKVQNALAEDMGADSMTALSKMVEVMGLIPKMGVERAMDATGSAIFKLASTSTATGTNIVEFSKRLMGLANIAHISTADLLALGSAADSMALMPEVAATAFNKLITAVQKQPNLIENALHIEKGTISDMYQAGHMTEALVTIFEKMREKGGMNALMQSGVFKDLGSDGARLVAVMATMANRVDMLNAHLAVSRQAFEEGTAVAQEYAIQMDTAAAYSERAANIWEKAFVNPEGVDTVKEFTKAWYEVSKALTSNKVAMAEVKFLLGGILELLKGILYFLPALLSGLAVLGAGRMFVALRSALEMTRLSAVGLTLSINGLKTAWTALSAVGKANWIGAAATALFMIIEAFGMFNKKVQEATGYMNGFKKDLGDLNVEYGKAEAELRRYRRAIDEANTGSKQRLAAINTFNSKFRPYLSNLLTEKSTALDVAKAYNEVTKAMRAKLALQLKEKDIESQVAPREQWTAERRQEYEKTVRGTQNSQYGAEWITGYAQDNRGKSIRDIARDLNERIFHTAESTFNSVFSQLGSSTLNELVRTKRKVNGHTVIDENVMGPQGRQLWAAMRYILQERSAENAMRRVNKKWEPEQKLMDELTAQQEETPYEPLIPAPDKDAERALTKAQREEKKRLKDEMDEAEKDSTAVINAIEEFYRLQESAVEQLVADGKMTREEADHALNYVKNRKELMLMNARRAIAGKDSDFEKLRKTMGQDMLRPDDQNSQRAMNTVQTIDVAKAAQRLQKFDGSKAVYDLNAGSFTQAMLKNAAQNELNIQRRQAKMAEEMEKLLMQYEYVEQAQRSFGDQLVNLGLITSGYEKMVQQLADGTEVVANTKDVQALANKVTGIGTRLFNVDMDDAEELRNMVDAIVTTVDEDGNKIRESFASMFPKLDEWMAQPEAFKQQMQAFYRSLLDYDTAYYDARKRNYELYKKQNQQMWAESGREDEYNKTFSTLENQQKMQDVFGAGQTFAQQYGMADVIAEDPEVKLYQEKLKAAAEYFQFVQDHQHTEQELREAGQAALEAYLAMAQKVSSEVAERASKIQELQKPATTFAEEVGEKWGDMMFNMESSQQTWNAIVKKMILGFATMTIKMTAENLTKKLQQALFYKQMLAMETEHQTEMLAVQTAFGVMRLQAQQGIDTALQTQKSVNDATTISKEASLATILTAMGISEGAAKTIGQLGWWGIPLIAVIAALLTGLLTSALSTAGKSAETSNTAAKPKIKLASGMLTYDEGNVQTVVGDDGRVYRAREQRSLPEGVSMVTEPIATRVNGQQALVGERGPEIVIGRKTTRAIQMNRPDLLRDLAMIDRGITTRKVRTFDEGNISDLASAIRPTDASTESAANDGSQTIDAATAEALRQMPAAMAAFAQVMTVIQQQGIPANLNMYGDNGAYKKFQQADKFYKKYGG